MRWYRLVAPAVAVALSAGCASPSPVLRGASPADGPATALERSQKPDPDPHVRRTVFEAVPEAFPSLQGGDVTVSIRAHVNGMPIFDDEVKEACFPELIRLPASLTEAERTAKQAQIFREGLDQLIDREILLQDAFDRLAKGGGIQYLDRLKTYAGREFEKAVRSMKSRAGVKTDEEFKDLLRTQGQTLEGMRRQFERNFMAREYVRSRVFPLVERGSGHQEILTYYQEHPAEFQAVDGVRWQDIFIDASKYRSREEARSFAQQLQARAKAGEDWAALAKFDNGDSSYRSGEGFGQRRGEIKPIEVEPTLFNMKDGEVGPVVEMATGFHVIRVVKRTRAGLLPLDEKLQDEIRKKLQNQVADRESKRLLAELKQKAVIEIETGP